METGKFRLSEANPLVYVHGGYFELGPKIRKFGWSVEKNRSRPRKNPKISHEETPFINRFITSCPVRLQHEE